MVEKTDDRQLYIVVSQTATILSRAMKLVTRKAYNHVSISLAPDLALMYSFGRKNPKNPFIGGFVEESADFGTFKRFSDTRVIVLQLNIDRDTFSAISDQLNTMMRDKTEYHYNYLGLWLAGFRIYPTFEHRYCCSEFVRMVLASNHINGASVLRKIPHPMNFLTLPQTRTVFSGKLTDFSLSAASGLIG